MNDWGIDTEKDKDKEFRLESGGAVDCFDSRCLLVTSPGNYPEGWKLLKRIYFLDGEAAFEILENHE